MNILLEFREIPEDLLKYFEPVRPGQKEDVWKISTRPYSGAHFATFPPALVEPCIKAGTSEHGCCPECGAPWERVVVNRRGFDVNGLCRGCGQPKNKHSQGAKSNMIEKRGQIVPCGANQTTGWKPTCAHTYGSNVPIPCTVFDPFIGSGTTAMVARALGRHGIGTDLSMEYLHLARERLSLDALEAWESGADANIKNCQVCEGIGTIVIYGNDGEPVDEANCANCNGKGCYRVERPANLEGLPMFEVNNVN